MQAIQLFKHGAPEVLILNEISIPVCQAEEVLIRVQAIGLNFVDTLIRKGSHLPFAHFPSTMPGEIEGIIEGIGKDVKNLQIGQHVTGYSNSGYAQFAVIPVNQVIVLPDKHPIGKGMLIQNLTAQNLLHQSTAYYSSCRRGGVNSHKNS